MTPGCLISVCWPGLSLLARAFAVDEDSAITGWDTVYSYAYEQGDIL